jgi:phage tail sheath protein FI
VDFESVYGQYQSYSYLHPTVETFFEEGGTQCWISRVAGPSATTGFVTLNDGTNDTVTFTANGPGVWSSGLSITTVAGGIANSRTVTLALSGVTIFVATDTTATDQIVSKFASSTIASYYVTVTDEGAALVDIFAAQSLSAGDDDRSNVTSAHYITGLTLFNDAYGVGAVACPESEVQAVYAGLLAHANSHNRIAIIHTAAAQTASQAETVGITIRGNESNTEHGALYWPWINVPTSLVGVTRVIPPDGYVAAARARAHNGKGSHQPGAGVISVSRWIVSLESEANSATGNALDYDNVNALRVIDGAIRVYGARSLSNDTSNFRYITAQDTVNGVVYEANKTLEELVFSVIDGRGNIFAAVQARLIAILEPRRISGALYEAFDPVGKRIDMGYTVRCDKSLNPATQLADGLVKAKIGVRVSSVGDQINVDIVKSNLTTSVV